MLHIESSRCYNYFNFTIRVDSVKPKHGAPDYKTLAGIESAIQKPVPGQQSLQINM